MTLTFNIIFTHGTVFELRAFAWSIARHSGCRLRLVANGLEDAESSRLSRFCARDDRFEFHRHPSDKMAEHGDVLNELLAFEEDEYFAFMDSDVFAVGPFLDEALAALDGCSAVFSGVPVWATETDQVAPAWVRKYGGPQNRVESGACLGTSYFAIYRAGALRSFIAEHGVGLEKTKDARSLPPRVREALRDARCLVDGYETAKALNLLLDAAGHRLRVIDLPGIRHVGGLSLLAKKRKGQRQYLPDDDETPAGFVNPEKPWIPRKRFTCHYLSSHVYGLARGEPASVGLAVEEPDVRARVEETARRLSDLYRDFAASDFEA